MTIRHLSILISLVLLIVTSCSSSVKIVNYLDYNEPLILTITVIDSAGFSHIDRELIATKSIKYKRFIHWCEINSDNWRTTIASYSVKASITQSNFRLLIYDDYVAVGYIDNTNKSRQYTKKITKGELDFLF